MLFPIVRLLSSGMPHLASFLKKKIEPFELKVSLSMQLFKCLHSLHPSCHLICSLFHIVFHPSRPTISSSSTFLNKGASFNVSPGIILALSHQSAGIDLKCSIQIKIHAKMINSFFLTLVHESNLSACVCVALFPHKSFEFRRSWVYCSN